MRLPSCSHAAHELAKEQRKNFGEDITSAIRYAKKKVSSLLCIGWVCSSNSVTHFRVSLSSVRPSYIVSLLQDTLSDVCSCTLVVITMVTVTAFFPNFGACRGLGAQSVNEDTKTRRLSRESFVFWLILHMTSLLHNMGYILIFFFLCVGIAAVLTVE